jgi:tetratricopeptide (TPR) repeat protein
VKLLALAAIMGIGVFSAMVLWGCSGCSRTTSEYGQHSNGAGLWGPGIRPAQGDAARSLRNAHYLKLMGRPELALKELEAAHQENTGNLKVLDALARTYEEVGEFDRAQKLYQQALALDPSNQALNNNLCFSYYLTGQYEKAEACFRQALAKNPQNLTVRNNLGLLLCRQGRSQEALRLWQKAEGEMAAQKKMQQVMVALGIGDQPQYAQNLQPAAAAAPIALDSGPGSPSLTPAPAVPASQPPTPAASPIKVPGPIKLAAQPVPAAASSHNEGAALGPSGKSASPQSQKPSAAKRAKSEPPSSRALAKTDARGVQKKAAAKVLAEPQARTHQTPAPSQEAAAPVKNATPAPTRERPKSLKTQMAAVLDRLINSGIEVANGTGAYRLASRTSSMLTAEGFKVVHIGNYQGFGVENTVIYYRQGSEDVARTLSARFFPQSKVAIGEEFAPGADIKIVLGKDGSTSADLASEPETAAEKVAAGLGSDPQQLKPAAAATAPAPAAAPAKAPAPAALPAAAAVPTKTASREASDHPYLTAVELETWGVEIRNGSGAQNLAHKARAMLSQEGFNVTCIGNHIDFGAEKTIIYYRPGAEKMARNLNQQFFPHSQLEQSAKLQGEVAVKVLLGKDLLQRTDVMAKLSD